MSNPRDEVRAVEKHARLLETRIAELERKVEELLHRTNDSGLKAVGLKGEEEPIMFNSKGIRPGGREVY